MLHKFNDTLTVEKFLNHSISQNISAGSIEQVDARHLSERVIAEVNNTALNGPQNPLKPDEVNIQFILVTDYVVGSLDSKNVTDMLRTLSTEMNATFIVLSSNTTYTDGNFRNDVWNMNPAYVNWTPNGQNNPICSYIHQSSNNSNLTTPSPSFTGGATLNIYLFFSTDYINKTGIGTVIELLSQLTARRWRFPCQQYRTIECHVTMSNFDTGTHDRSCFMDDIDFASDDDSVKTCSNELFTQWLLLGNDSDSTGMDGNNPDVSCQKNYDSLFDTFTYYNQQGKLKFLIITDLPMLCPYNTISVTNILRNYNDFFAGAPLTVVVIDKENDKTVAESWAPIFPPTQLPNLYKINKIEELLDNINKSINFCLDFVPWIDYDTKMIETVNYPVWYYYSIGASLFVVLVVIAIFAKRRYNKRQKRLKRISEARNRMSLARITISETSGNQYLYELPTDIWKVSMDCLAMNYETAIGKGGFSVVHSGILRGKAPILNIFPSIAMQQFTNCAVAVKTLPLHSDENARTKFRDEISLMKKIGYHVHLVSMLGCNCSTDRPILVMERAKYNLLEWLTSKREESVTIIDPDLEKTLLSLSWQIADGMIYLSSKNFVHRDLAARNILLDAELKAMISDFGLCKSLEEDGQVLTIVGEKLPLKWMALESLQDQQFSKKTDVLGREPYGKIAVNKLITFLQQGKRLEKPSFATEIIYDCMKRCWHVNAAQRPDFCRIQSHFAGLLEDRVENYGYLTATTTTTEQLDDDVVSFGDSV